MNNIRNLILASIKEVSEKYQYHGFWKYGTAYVNGVEDNPYLYFPSEEYCYNALMKEYNNLTDDDFTAKLVDVCMSFSDGDELNIPFELFKQKPKIRIAVEYNRDGPYGVLYINYKAEETENQIYQRLLAEIFKRATQKYSLKFDFIMTQEQKAKRYDEALKIAKSWLKLDNNDLCNDDLKTLFPELKESEDELTWLTKYIEEEAYSLSIDIRDDEDRIKLKKLQKALAWLEKQEGCEHIKKDWLEHIKQSWYKEGFIDGKYSTRTSKEWTINDAATLKELIDFLENGTAKLQHDLTKYANWLKIQFTPIEKQDKKKPFDYENANIQQKDFAPKVEPKFENGQWIVWQDKCYKVNYNGCGYELVDQNGLNTSLEYGTIEENAHLWTIQDAKPGDVIYLPNGNDEYYFFIFKGIENAAVMSFAHFYQYDDDTSEVEGTTDNLSSVNDVFQPATKEQCELLFQKIKEAGYVWNEEKKELKKIEQKPTDKNETAFHEGDWIVQENIGVYKVIEVCESWYEVIDIEGNHYSIGFDKEYMCHFWSIKDAKDGDVLVDGYSGAPFIFKGLLDPHHPNCPVAYCGIDDEDYVSVSYDDSWWTDDSVKPATKEQRDLLFEKMKEEGYEWDEEKKELKLLITKRSR